MVAKVLCVFHCDEYEERELFYEWVSTNMPGFYAQFENPGGFVLDFEKILTVEPHGS